MAIKVNLYMTGHLIKIVMHPKIMSPAIPEFGELSQRTVCPKVNFCSIGKK